MHSRAAAALAVVLLANCEVPLDQGRPVASVTVVPDSAAMLVGARLQLTATPKDLAGTVLTGRVLAWASSDTTVAAVSGNGLVTAKGAGSASITASAEGKTGTAAITVALAPVASVTVSPATATVSVGATAQLTAITKDSAGNVLTARAITWTSSSSSVATVSGTGLVTGVRAGSATITATAEGKSGTAVITVVTVPVASVTVSPAAANVTVGSTVQLAATTKDSAGNALTGRVVTWTSSSPTVATVSGGGLVTGVGAGSITITATSEGKTGTAAITVALAPVASVTVTPATASVTVGATVQLAATTRDSAGNVLTGRVVTWTSSSPSLATVSSAGLVAGVGAGSVTIAATSEGKSGVAGVTVTPAGSAATCTATGSGVCYYVDAAAGSDGSPGDSAHPFHTVQHAADLVKPGDEVIVRNGVYTGNATAVLNITRGGTAANWVVFKAEHKWGAVLDGQGSPGVKAVTDAGVLFGASYVLVEGFEIRWVWHDGVDLGADNITVRGTNIHDVGRYCESGTYGLSGLTGYANNLVVEQNVIHDIGRLNPGEYGCSPTTPYWQNHDHGIYHEYGNNVIIRNNIFYNLTHGWGIQRYAGSGATVDQLYIVNNTFAFPNPNRVGQVLVATTTTNSVIANNIFYQPLTAGILFDPGATTSNVTVANNLTAGGVANYGSPSGTTFSNNLDNTDPLLVNAAGFDFHLTAGSPAIRAGLSLPYVLNDFDSVIRPQGVAYDIGAYQFK